MFYWTVENQYSTNNCPNDLRCHELSVAYMYMLQVLDEVV